MASAPQLPEVDFEAMAAEEVLRWAYAEFGDKLCLTCSWQKQSSVLVHMVSELELDLPVIELDTHLLSRESYETRTGPKVRWAARYDVWKVHPLADWDEKRVWAYIQFNEIPYNPLHDVGFRSIGCIPCTRPTSPEEEERAGRWAGSDKLECGIHLDTPLRKEPSAQRTGGGGLGEPGGFPS